MIILKTESEIAKMRKAGLIAGGALKEIEKSVQAGISTFELDKIIHDYIISKGAKPSFLGYGGFPGSSCISVNNIIIHGIPSKNKIIKDGDIVSIDVGAYIDGFHGDTAKTFMVGNVSDNAKALVNATKESLDAVIPILRDGVRLGDIGATVEEYVTKLGYSVVKDYVGHGVGKNLHEDPSVPNYGRRGHGLRLPKGATVAIEPMVNEGTGNVIVDNNDGWTVYTADNKLSAHFEHTFYIDDNKAHLLTFVYD